MEWSMLNYLLQLFSMELMDLSKRVDFLKNYINFFSIHLLEL